MSIRDEQREKVTGLLAGHLLETGLAETSLRQLARAAGISDRMLLYYFDDKADVLSAAARRIAQDMSRDLEAALPDGLILSPAALIPLAAELTAGPQMKQFMRLWVEMIGAAARLEEPFVAIASELFASFRASLVPRLDLPAGADREATASAVIALIDGLALIAICSTDDEMSRLRAALPTLFGAGQKG